MCRNKCPICGGYKYRQSSVCRRCYDKERESPIRNCRYCNNEFKVSRAAINRGQGIYCSIICARKGSPTRKRDIVCCGNCGIKFETHLSEIKRKVGDGNYCSPNCWYEWIKKENRKTRVMGDYQLERYSLDAARWRYSVLKRDGHRCRSCHIDNNLHVHHIKRYIDYKDIRWDIDNGITLCQDCHRYVTGQEKQHEAILSFICYLPFFYCEFNLDFVNALIGTAEYYDKNEKK